MPHMSLVRLQHDKLLFCCKIIIYVNTISFISSIKYNMLDKNIFILWLQGWEHATWLNKQVAESWEINNPDWKIHYIDLMNLYLKLIP